MQLQAYIMFEHFHPYFPRAKVKSKSHIMPTPDLSSCGTGLKSFRCPTSPPWVSGVGVDTLRITFLITCPMWTNAERFDGVKTTNSLCVSCFFQGYEVIRYFSTDEVTILVHVVFLCHRLAWDILCFFAL